MSALSRGWSILVASFKEVGALWFSPKNERRHVQTGPLHLWRQKRAFQVDFLQAHGLKPEHRLLDLGCGTLRGGIPLIDYLQEGHYYGVEARAPVLEDARRELHDANLEHKQPVLVLSENLAALDLGIKFDVIWAYAVLFHMADPIVAEVFDLVGRHLAGDGVFYANVRIGDPRAASLKWQGFPIVWRPRAFYDDLAARHGLTSKDLGSMDALGDVSGLQFVDEPHMLEFRRR